ncbi:ATP-grasp domain-containing protein [soil metagenome]
MIILAGAGSYRCPAFKRAAVRLGIDLTEAVDVPEPLSSTWKPVLAIDYVDPDRSARSVAEFAQRTGAVAVLALDDSATLIASKASSIARLPHNDPVASLAARDKLLMRQKLRDFGAPTPWFLAVHASAAAEDLPVEVTFPCVVKPTLLSGSRGVIRADNPLELQNAFKRVVRILAYQGADLDTTPILIEEYLPGDEVAVEAIATSGQVQILSIFDKPDPLHGPFFEETIYITPSRHSEAVQSLIQLRTAEAAAALGIRHGPIHAELRIHHDQAWIIEVAGRSIGGLCSTILEYGSGKSLEELILRNAVGWEVGDARLSNEAVGVMMIPIPRSGVLKSITGEDSAISVPGVTGLEITAKINSPIDALPEGSSYLGFIFARGSSPSEVEASLRSAHNRLTIRIDPLLSMARIA